MPAAAYEISAAVSAPRVLVPLAALMWHNARKLAVASAFISLRFQLIITCKIWCIDIDISILTD